MTSCFVYSAGNLGDFERVYKRKTEARDALKAEYAESQGRVKTHQEAMESCRRELGEAQYAGVDGRGGFPKTSPKQANILPPVPNYPNTTRSPPKH